MRIISRAFCFGFLLMVCCTSAQAGIVIGDSIDWLVVSRDQIAIGKLIQIDSGRRDSGIASNKTFRFDVIQTLKGHPATQAWADRYYPDDVQRVPVGTEFLLFFKDGKQADYAINLSSPTVRAGYREIALTMDFDVLKTRKAILDTVQARVEKLGHERPNGAIRLEIPDDKPAFMALWSGSACFLNVPADSEFKTKFMEQLRSASIKTRATAAYWLVKYPGQDVVKALKPLLSDPGSDVLQTLKNNQRQDVTVYPVRQAAYKTLTTWGIEVPKPAGYDPDYPSFFLE